MRPVFSSRSFFAPLQVFIDGFQVVVEPGGQLVTDMQSAANSKRSVSRDAGHAVEVRVVAGNGGNAELPHRRDDQCIAAKQAVLLTDGGRSGNDRRWRHQYLDSKSRHCVNRSPEARKRLNNLRMASQPLADTGRCPGVSVDGLQGHHSAEYRQTSWRLANAKLRIQRDAFQGRRVAGPAEHARRFMDELNIRNYNRSRPGCTSNLGAV